MEEADQFTTFPGAKPAGQGQQVPDLGRAGVADGPGMEPVAALPSVPLAVARNAAAGFRPVLVLLGLILVALVLVKLARAQVGLTKTDPAEAGLAAAGYVRRRAGQRPGTA